MYIDKYMVITPATKTYGKPNVKLLDKLKSATAIASNAVVLKLSLDLPDSLFKKPQLSAKIKVNEDQVSKPVIEPEVIQNIQEIISKQLNVDLKISLVEEEKQPKRKR